MENNERFYMKKKDNSINRNGHDENSHKGRYKPSKAVIALSITTAILGVTTIGFAAGYGVMKSQAQDYGTRLENVYQQNFYDLVDSVNNAEIKLSKILNSSTSAYQKKLLVEVSKNATTAEESISSLPLSQDDINQNVRMINQISGYTSTLADKLAEGGNLTAAEKDTLQEIYDNVLTMKNELNKFARKIQAGYNILDNSMNLRTGRSDFSSQMAQIHDVDIEYPTLIYDGPFSDSVVNSKIKGLSGNKVSKEEASEVLNKMFKNVVSVHFETETNGRFETYNFRLKNSNDEMQYVQVSKTGGHILTVSGTGSAGNSSIQEDDAEKIALEFAKENGIENPKVVWKDTIANDSYFNIAPVQNGVVLYPDLVKVKIDLVSGSIVGYDATTYYTNHTSRSLGSFGTSIETARAKIPTSLTVVGERKVLAPLEYNREVLCYEFECVNSDDTYYFYINGSTGDEENILKVIKTDDGSKLL